MQPLDLISGALLDIGARAAGELPAPEDTSEAFILMNLMLDQWSNEKMMIFCTQEVIHELTASKYIYQIGPPGSGLTPDIGASFTGQIVNDAGGGILTVTSLTSGALSVGQIINPTGTLPAGTAITSYGTATGGNGLGAIGTYFTNLNGVIQVNGPFTSYQPRPLRINSAFVRVVNSSAGTLDYPVTPIHQEDYAKIGIKTLPGPWPRAVYYQASEPNGILNYWPNPSQGEMHLFCDTVLNNFATLNDTVQLPQGVGMAIRRNLAMLLMPGYGKINATQIAMISESAKEGKALIKRTNMQPTQLSSFDGALYQGASNDAGWILSGGFLY